MSADAKIRFFDDLASRWDGFHDMAALHAQLHEALDGFGIRADERILDVGCGTGNLTEVLLERLSPEGRVIAVDYSPQMIAAARAKLGDDRVDWRVADVSDLELDEKELDRIICFSVWPHIDDPGAVARRFDRFLKPGGRAHVWHVASRETINGIHAEAGDAVSMDVLAPAAQTARVFEDAGFAVTDVVDDDLGYLVTAVKPVRTV